MNFKLLLARIAARIERWTDVLRRPSKAEPSITPYVGYATPQHLIVRGRVLATRQERLMRPDQSRFANFRAMIGLFRTDEMADVIVSAGEVMTRTDEEGYFTLELPRGDATGRTIVTVTLGKKSWQCPVIIPDTAASYGIISDIDDTMILTGAYSLARNIWTSLTGNAATRLVFPDAVRLMARLNTVVSPVFFVSSSPWNFYPFLREIMSKSQLPEAPMFLRDYGISETQFITGTHGDHKGQAIDTILAANPNLPFVLIGDTGQHDAHVYADAVKRHPGRIARVILRQAGPRQDAHAISALRAAGIPVHVAPSYDDMDF
ncbi:Phosphatidate phosphatase APP1 [Cognatiyoonia koreensis]|uniref:Phosphatidate phosphatase APP1 n=1 Tax=Cognatiyoonia koreensis TaxID=364200 RepID=A0A1I0RL68_9RHOB|nr:phosphatase domain-containing protein [Cognatiyoonia koreensis]SEW41848.1 Phosphatidate phosphatase APP1 [Cognatiyoonia koreensis]